MGRCFQTLWVEWSGQLKQHEQWERAREQVAEQEARADKAEQLYGQAVKGALEAVCEYMGLQVNAYPVVEAWVNLTVNNLVDRIYGYIFLSKPEKLYRLASHLRRLFSLRRRGPKKL